MFNDNVDKKFKVAYFLSSFLLSYLFLMIIVYVQYIESNGRVLPNFAILLTPKKISFGLLTLLAGTSFIKLKYVKKKIEEDTQFLRTKGEVGQIGYSYNSGSREFILGVLLPVVTTISVSDTPITGLVGVILLQAILGYFYWNSNELFVNVPLMILGYSLVVGEQGEQSLLLFVQNRQLKSLLGKKVKFVFLGSSDESNLGIVGGLVENG